MIPYIKYTCVFEFRRRIHFALVEITDIDKTSLPSLTPKIKQRGMKFLGFYLQCWTGNILA